MTHPTTTADVFSAAMLEQHIAVLGKTGSGKTCTAKLLVEQVSPRDRVCILDPIKSDWWGLTSSGDGKSPGLPFQILGGPRGHVQIHEHAGVAIGELVASGALPLSIIDMAHFKPGGQASFFVNFAELLLKRMQGVLYLVMEEAHLFAPKERSGIGQETMAIHYAKMLATAGRSKGIRMVVVTQRTQSLHNALLGSCDTLIAHRLMAPADQDPVLKWLRANTDKETAAQVAASLSSLKKGEGWVCSGEAQIFERRTFARISTYDNSATPTRSSKQKSVTTAQVDVEKLRSVIGEAVQEAEANDPRKLKAKVAELEKKLARSTAQPAPCDNSEELAELRRAARQAEEHVAELRDRLRWVCDRAEAIVPQFDELAKQASLTVAVQDLEAPQREPERKASRPPSPGYVAPQQILHDVRARAQSNGHLSGPQQRVADAVAWWEAAGVDEPSKQQVAVVAGYKPTSSGYRNLLSQLRTDEVIAYPSPGYVARGPRAAGAMTPPDAPVSLAALHERIMGVLTEPQRKVLRVVIDEGVDLEKDELARRSGYQPTSSGYRNLLSQLRTIGLIDYPVPGMVRGTEVLYPEGMR